MDAASKTMTAETRAKLVTWQKNEITEHHIYMRLAEILKDPHNRDLIHRIGLDEHKHYQVFRSYTGEEVSPNRLQVTFYYWVARLFGLSFGMKLMERGEEHAQAAYSVALEELPEIIDIIKDEDEHEFLLLGMLDERILKYLGSIVLGLNDALVELTGTLAGLTFAFQNTNLIAFSGLITGISASFSMAASEYLSSRADEGGTNPLTSAVYTGIAYIFTVVVLVFPYFLLKNYFACLGWTLVNAILVIAVFNFYLAVARDLKFGKRFLEMALVSIGVALFSFGVGYAIRVLFGIQI